MLFMLAQIQSISTNKEQNKRAVTLFQRLKINIIQKIINKGSTKLEKEQNIFQK